jgi:hypothetical protein
VPRFVLPPQLHTPRSVVARLCSSESCGYLAPDLSLAKVVPMPLRWERARPNTEGHRPKPPGSPNREYSGSERPAVPERWRRSLRCDRLTLSIRPLDAVPELTPKRYRIATRFFESLSLEMASSRMIRSSHSTASRIRGSRQYRGGKPQRFAQCK